MLHKLSIALLFAVMTCGQIAFAQIFSSGECPKMELPKEFVWAAFAGDWYENSRFSGTLQAGEECAKTQFIDVKDGTMGLIYEALNIFNRTVNIEVTAKILGLGSMEFAFGGSKSESIVLGTDYKSWATLYSCVNVGIVRAEFAWILTRERNPSEETVHNAKEVLGRNGVSQKLLTNTRQKGCRAHI